MSSLPRHAINRLCALHLVLGLIDAAAAPVRDGGLTDDERGKAAVVCSRIAMSVERAKRMEPQSQGDRRLTNAINRRNIVLWASFSEDVDAREAVAMGIAQVAEEEESIPRTPALLAKRLEWGTLHGLLAELYDILDPELDAVAQIDRGCAVGAAMAAA